MKKNSYNTNVSFEDFENALMSPGSHKLPIDELVKDRMEQARESQKKETELKRAHRKAKQLKATPISTKNNG